ncbi:hypothetical protein IQ07DRAFT_428500 [Pyrenochaeta sp. DS3sAY3a]|nr:hypothetical protein IQ07DRAFT_428500 [Pyrenochaeta sp. DS3sAY3a]
MHLRLYQETPHSYGPKSEAEQQQSGEFNVLVPGSYVDSSMPAGTACPSASESNLYLSPKRHRCAMWCDAVVIAGSYWTACCTIVGCCMPRPSARMRASRIIVSVDYSIGCGWLDAAFDPFRSGHAVAAGVLFYRQSSVVILPSHMTKRISTASDVVGLDLGFGVIAILLSLLPCWSRPIEKSYTRLDTGLLES